MKLPTMSTVNRQALLHWAWQQRFGGAPLTNLRLTVLPTQRRAIWREFKTLCADVGLRASRRERQRGECTGTTKAASRRESPSLSAAFPDSRRGDMDLPERTWGGLTPAPISSLRLARPETGLQPRCQTAIHP